jgi:hypothetical protein
VTARPFVDKLLAGARLKGVIGTALRTREDFRFIGKFQELLVQTSKKQRGEFLRQ